MLRELVEAGYAERIWEAGNVTATWKFFDTASRTAESK